MYTSANSKVKNESKRPRDHEYLRLPIRTLLPHPVFFVGPLCRASRLINMGMYDLIYMEPPREIYLKNGQSTRILKAGAADMEEILALQKIAYITEAEIYGDFDIPPLRQTYDEIAREFSDHVFLKAETKGRIAGSVRARGIDDTCQIGRLIVDPVFRGQGLGTALMAAIEKEFETFKRYELFTGDRSERNITLYERLGYRIYRSEQVSCSLCLVFLEKYSKGSRQGTADTD